jgi:peptidoglycan/xylan/chitin deacetylase (PgdA/CDA1 family)
MSRQRGSASLGQLITGLLVLPLSVLPFVGYATFTPEGRLVRDRAVVAVAPPSLPRLSSAQRAAVALRAPRYDGGVMALAYHGIGSGSDGDGRGGRFVISAQRFAEHLAVLKAAGMHVVTAADVAQAFTAHRPLPANAVMVSFDDGRADAMLFADHLLAQARMRATMFVITGAASRPGVYYASWDAIGSYARSGRWDIESHTADLHHEQKVSGGAELPALTSRAPRESLNTYAARVRADLGHASAAIERHVGHRPTAFAYPFGAYGAERTNDPAIREVLRKEVGRRYAVAFHQDDQGTIPLVTADQDRLGLRRLEVANWSGLQLLNRITAAAGGSVPDGADPLEPAFPDPTPAAGGAAEAGAASLPAGQTLPDPTLPRFSVNVPPVTLPSVVPLPPPLPLPSVVPIPPPVVTIPPLVVTIPPPAVTIPTVPPTTTTTVRPPTTTTTVRPTTTTTVPRTTTTVPPTTTTTVPPTCSPTGKGPKTCPHGGSR